MVVLVEIIRIGFCMYVLMVEELYEVMLKLFTWMLCIKCAHFITKKIQFMVKVNDYHLTFNLNGVLVRTRKGQIKFHPMVLKLGLKQFLSTCINKFIVYIWFSVMKRNFAKHLEIIIKTIGVVLPSFKIMD
jgi:hypothetical protein